MAVTLRFGNATAKLIGVLLLTTGLVAPAALAELPKGAGDMLKTAADSNDRATFETLLKTALTTWPDERGAILTLAYSLKPDWMAADHKTELDQAKAAAEAKEQALRDRGIVHYLDPKLWNGQAELGASTSTGDSQQQAVSLGLSFHRKFGPEWEHNIDLGLDYGRSSGATSQRRVVGKYETLWKPWVRGFMINYTEVEFDKFSGYDYRVVENLGLGYHVIESATQSLRMEGGPGVRFYKLAETGDSMTELLARLSSTYEIKFTDNLSLKERVAAIFGADSTTLENRVSLSARINAHMAAKVSFEVKYDSSAPLDTAPWDTNTRATLVYDF